MNGRRFQDKHHAVGFHTSPHLFAMLILLLNPIGCNPGPLLTRMVSAIFRTPGAMRIKPCPAPRLKPRSRLTKSILEARELIAAGDGEHPGSEQICNRVRDVSAIAWIGDKTGQSIRQPAPELSLTRGHTALLDHSRKYQIVASLFFLRAHASGSFLIAANGNCIRYFGAIKGC